MNCEYAFFTSAGDNANYGCEVWFPTSWYLACYGDKKVRLTRDCSSLTHANPRRLVVGCRNMFFCYCVYIWARPVW